MSASSSTTKIRGFPAKLSAGGCPTLTLIGLFVDEDTIAMEFEQIVFQDCCKEIKR
jgi:hypothetical protein